MIHRLLLMRCSIFVVLIKELKNVEILCNLFVNGFLYQTIMLYGSFNQRNSSLGRACTLVLLRTLISIIDSCKDKFL